MRGRLAIGIVTAMRSLWAKPRWPTRLNSGCWPRLVVEAFKVLLIDFARESGNKVEVSFGPVGALQTRLKNG